LFKTYKTIENVWIGAKFTCNQFKWTDNSDHSFTNWVVGNPKNKTGDDCVQMLAEEPSAGKWIDEPCKKNNLIVCQKMQTWTLTQMQKSFLELRKNPVPIGFIYVQLPGQPEPKSLWPQVKWAEVSEEYAGLFFRSVGGTSAQFGETQEEDFKSFSVYYCNGCGATNYNVDVPKNGQWSDKFLSGHSTGGATDYMTFRYTSGEIRPRNKAVRIWKRVE